MKHNVEEKHETDQNGNPAGGITKGIGIEITWQNGPLGRHAADCGPGSAVCVVGCTRREPDGASVEGVIAAAIGRLKYYQGSKFKCDENSKAIRFLEMASDVLDSRTGRREAYRTEGTHEGN